MSVTPTENTKGAIMNHILETVVVLSLLSFLAMGQDLDLPLGRCLYWGQCTRVVTVTDRSGTLRTREMDYTCPKEAECETSYQEWGPCTVACGGGFRRRFGFCDGPLCDRWVTDVEACNTEPCEARDGFWSAWGSWTATACSASCCGGTQDRTRTRACSSESSCPGSDIETETSVACNTAACPLSCDGEPVGTFFNDPCTACSNTFYACTEDNNVLALNCPSGQVWSSSQNACQFSCD